jgi:hypothetical protein
MLPNVRFTYQGHFQNRRRSSKMEKKNVVCLEAGGVSETLVTVTKPTRGHCFKNPRTLTSLKFHKFFFFHVLILSKDFFYLNRTCRRRSCEILRCIGRYFSMIRKNMLPRSSGYNSPRKLFLNSKNREEGCSMRLRSTSILYQ